MRGTLRSIARSIAAFACLLGLSAVAARAEISKCDATTTGVSDLPLIERAAARPGGDELAIFLTGDGGWAKLDRDLAGRLSDSGVTVIGLNSARYLSRPRTPDELACDVSRVIRHYLAVYRRSRVLLVGYSRGADLLPFVANRLPPELSARLALVALLGPGERANFQFRFSDLWRNVDRSSDVPIGPELARLQGKGVRILCIYGSEERESLCRRADRGQVKTLMRTGGHHFDGDYGGLADAIMLELRRRPSSGRNRDSSHSRHSSRIS